MTSFSYLCYLCLGLSLFRPLEAFDPSSVEYEVSGSPAPACNSKYTYVEMPDETPKEIRDLEKAMYVNDRCPKKVHNVDPAEGLPEDCCVIQHTSEIKEGEQVEMPEMWMIIEMQADEPVAWNKRTSDIAPEDGWRSLMPNDPDNESLPKLKVEATKLTGGYYQEEVVAQQLANEVNQALFKDALVTG